MEQAVAEYRVHANRLKHLITEHTERAQAFLDRRRAELEAYIAVPVPAALTVPGSTPPTAVTTVGISRAMAALQMARQTGGVWNLPPLQRGIAIEEILGRSPLLPQNFPKIDRFSEGVAVSIKSIDLRAPTYQNIKALTRKVKGYIDAMATYQGQPIAWGGVTILPGAITGRKVELAIPTGVGTQEQQAALEALQRYAESVGVELVISPLT